MKEKFELSDDFIADFHEGISISNNRHIHSVYEFYFLCNGEIEYFTENGYVTVKKGDLVIIPPNTIHKSIPKSTPSRQRILFYIKKNFLESFGEDILMPHIGVYHLNEKEKNILYDIFEEYNNDRNESFIKANLCILAIQLSRKEHSVSYENKNSINERIEKIIKYINANYAMEITLEETAKIFFMNTSYLSRIFKEKTGVKFTEYLNKYRIKKSIELLSNTDLSVTEISAKTGFNSSNHYCKVFKQVMGTSPLNYRKNLRG